MTGGDAPQSRQRLFPTWVLLLSGGIILSTLIPHAWQRLTAKPGEHFAGIVEQVDDQNLYLTYVEQVRRGALLVEVYQTAERVPPLLPSLPWLAIGLLARALPVPILVTYHLVRLLWGLTYLLLVWVLMREFFSEPAARAFGFVAAALGSGLAAVADGVNALTGRHVLMSSDIMPEMWGYHSLWLPHFALALSLLALLLMLLLRAYRRPSGWLAAGAAATLALLALIHPYDVAVIAPLLVGHFVYCRIARPEGWRGAAINLWALAGTIPAVGILWWQRTTNPLVASWAEQNVLRSPPPDAYLLGLGLILPLAIGGRLAIGRRRRETARDWLMIFWPLVAAVAVYSYPLVPFERRCVEGLHLPLAILAAAGLAWWVVPWLQSRLRMVARRATACAMALLLVGILPTDVWLLARLSTTNEPVIPADWARTFEWIEAAAPAEARFMTTHLTGTFLARYALRHVHMGHWHVTVDVGRKREMAAELFAEDTSPQRRLAILREAGCGWVAADGQQAHLLVEVEGLDEVRAAPEMTVYRLRKPPPPPRLPATR